MLIDQWIFYHGSRGWCPGDPFDSLVSNQNISYLGTRDGCSYSSDPVLCSLNIGFSALASGAWCSQCFCSSLWSEYLLPWLQKFCAFSDSCLTLKRDCRTSLNLAESGIVGKSKNRTRTADSFKNFFVMSPNCLMKWPCLKEINRKCLKYVETRFALGQEGFLVSYWLETRREMHPSGFHFLLGISHSVFEASR